MSADKIIEIPITDSERTRSLSFETLRDVGPGLLPYYCVVRGGREVSVARESLSLEERRIICEVLQALGESAIREADTLVAHLHARS